MSSGTATPYAPPIVVDALEIRYQGSLEPQDVTLSFDGRIEDMFLHHLAGLQRLIQLGGAGGSEFPPESGTCEWLVGPRGMPKPETTGPWTWRVRGVCAVGWRYLFHRLPIYFARPGIRILPKALSFIGSAPITSVEGSVDTARLREWMASPAPQPGAWSDIPFAVEHVRSKKGLTIQLTLASAPAPDATARLLEVLKCWTSGANYLPTVEGSMSGPMGFLREKNAHEGHAFEVGFPKADVASAASLALLQNLLRRYHLEVAPIEKVRFAAVDGPEAAKPAKPASLV